MVPNGSLLADKSLEGTSFKIQILKQPEEQVLQCFGKSSQKNKESGDIEKNPK